MSWHPNDLVSDRDLQDYESAILTTFGQASWQPRRTKALEDWLFPILKGQNFDPYKLRTRYEPDQVLAYTGSAYTDKTSAAKDATEDDLNLAAIFATPASDALLVGSVAPFRGLFFRFLESLNSAVASTLTVEYWNGVWTGLALQNGTIHASGKTFSGGGTVSWMLPADWSRRAVNSSSPLYWARLTVSATPTGAKTTQIGCVRASALRAPATLRTLMLIMREAPTGGEGPWKEKAEYYETEANAALQRALLIVGGEFDTDESDQVSEDEAAQTAAEVGGGWRLERA